MQRVNQQKKSQQKKTQPNRNRNGKQIKWILGIMLCVLGFSMVSFAWYYRKTNKEAETENREVMVPYYLYLLDDSESASFQLAVGHLHPSETKSVIVGVSNKAVGQSGVVYPVGRNSEFAYKLELAYTPNLPMEYKIYELMETDAPTTEDSSVIKIENENGDAIRYLKPVTLNGEVNQLEISSDSDEITERYNKEMYGENAAPETVVNYIQYDVYENDAMGNFLSLSTKSEDSNTDYDLDYYMIELKWQDGIVFDNYLKETDLVYVIVTALQPEPEER